MFYFLQETEEIIGDVLNVEVFRQCVGKKDLVGAYSVLSNFGCVVHPGTKIQERNDLSLLLDVPVVVNINANFITIVYEILEYRPEKNESSCFA